MTEDGLVVLFKGDASGLIKEANAASQALNEMFNVSSEVNQAFVGNMQSSEGMSRSLSQLTSDLQVYRRALAEATDTGAFSRAAANIALTEQQIEHLNNTARNIGKSLGDNVSKGSDKAAYALTNFSRILQDLPFGFVAIQNNLNPMLESFQRLEKDTEGAGGAIGAMITELSGPAGIGIALAAVSFLITTFGKNLTASGDNAEAASKQLNEYKQALSDLGEETKRISGDITRASKVNVARIQAKTDDPQAIYVEQQKSLLDERELISAEMARIQRNVVQLENRGLQDSKEALEGHKRIGELEKAYYDKQAEIDISNFKNQERIRHEQEQADKDAAAKREKSLKDYQKYLQELRDAGNWLRGFKTPKIDFAKDSPFVAPAHDFVGDYIQNLNEQAAKAEPKLDLSRTAEALRSELLNQSSVNFRKIGEEMPKTVTIDGVEIALKDVKMGEMADKEIKDALEKGLTDLAGAKQNVNDAINSMVEGGLNAFGEAFGQFAAGNFAAGIETFISFLSSALASIGQALIKYGLIKETADKIIIGGWAVPGGAAVALGLAAIAASSLLKSIKVSGMAAGGIVSGPTLAMVGEGAGTSLSNPEVVAPLRDLKKYIGGGQTQILVTSRLRGNDMILQNERTIRKQGRIH